jgi:hypothetical protein
LKLLYKASIRFSYFQFKEKFAREYGIPTSVKHEFKKYNYSSSDECPLTLFQEKKKMKKEEYTVSSTLSFLD